MYLTEIKCSKCGKIFVPAPEHVYKDMYRNKKRIYCSWHCYNHRNDKQPRKKWKAASEDGTVIKTFTSATDAAEQTGFCVKKIRMACRDQKPYMGFIWKYTE